MSNSVRCLRVLAAIILGIAARGSSSAADAEGTTIWTYPVPGQGAVEMDLPSSWKEVDRDRKHRLARFRPRGASEAELTLVVSCTGAPDPAFNGPPRLLSLVAEAGQETLDQAVESRFTIRELQGPASTGYYWSLRDRAPKKLRAAYIIRGMVGTGTVLLDFTLLTPQADTPEIRQALKMIAGSRQAEAGAEPAR